ncbi:hypothetical protein E2542_SST24452 [Spatholobus suberectus]|nr:hypothetical protein E2542_SST24452 [Spatholobus suberectus]
MDGMTKRELKETQLPPRAHVEGNAGANPIHLKAKSENRKKIRFTVRYAELALANTHIFGPLTCGAPFKDYFHVR